MFLGENLDQIYIGLDGGHVISNVAFRLGDIGCELKSLHLFLVRWRMEFGFGCL